MGAAQREITPDSQTGTASSATITSLRSSMVAGAIITASDMTSLLNMYNSMIGHYHTYTDLYQSATFGNNGDRNTYTEVKSTAAAASGASVVQTITSNANTSIPIIAATHNALAYNSRILQLHEHSLDDRTG